MLQRNQTTPKLESKCKWLIQLLSVGILNEAAKKEEEEEHKCEPLFENCLLDLAGFCLWKLRVVLWWLWQPHRPRNK